jgi:hypothetical protein
MTRKDSNKDKLDIVTNKKEALFLVGHSLYESEIESKLDMFKGLDLNNRKAWTTDTLDIYLRKLISTRIVANEFRVSSVVGGKATRKVSDKELISKLAHELNIQIMAIKHIYDEIKGQLQLESSKKDAKDFITAQIYAQLDEIDLAIMEAANDKARVEYHKIKMQLRDQLAKVENISEKNQVNNVTVGGNLNSQTVNNIDKQIVTSELADMSALIAKLLPNNNSTNK